MEGVYIVLANRSGCDLLRAGDRLSAGLCHVTRASELAADLANGGHPAVLDVLSDPHLRVESDPAEERVFEQCTDQAQRDH